MPVQPVRLARRDPQGLSPMKPYQQPSSTIACLKMGNPVIISVSAGDERCRYRHLRYSLIGFFGRGPEDREEGHLAQGKLWTCLHSFAESLFEGKHVRASCVDLSLGKQSVGREACRPRDRDSKLHCRYSTLYEPGICGAGLR